MKIVIILFLMFLLLAMIYVIRGLLDYLEDLLGHKPDIETVCGYISRAKLIG